MRSIAPGLQSSATGSVIQAERCSAASLAGWPSQRSFHSTWRQQCLPGLRPAGPCRAAASDGWNGCAAPEQPHAADRGVLVLPGLANKSGDYDELSQHLQERGLAAKVVQVGRTDWGRHTSPSTVLHWCKGTLTPRPATDWYLTRVAHALDALKREVDGAPITLLCHSAGGWLARVFMKEFGTAGIDRCVTLGSPHAPPAAGSEGVDQSRGMLEWCQDATPGAFHSEVQYVTIAGTFVKGARPTGEGSLIQKVAGAGYKQVCGDAEVWGDFIVPVASAHLEGATTVNVDNCFHSPLGTKIMGPWYGSAEMVDKWIHWVSDECDRLVPPGLQEHHASSTAVPGAAAAVHAAAAAAPAPALLHIAGGSRSSAGGSSSGRGAGMVRQHSGRLTA